MAASIVRLVIAGRVQGVWFRGWTIETATGLGLGGWVRNRRDGTVEAVFTGPEETVEDMVRRCRQGPAMARVDALNRLGLDPEDADLTPARGFHQRPSD